MVLLERAPTRCPSLFYPPPHPAHTKAKSHQRACCRPFPDKNIEVEASALDSAAVQASLGKLRAFLDQLGGVPITPAGSTLDEWGGRLGEVRSCGELAAAVVNLEAGINQLGSGLPTGVFQGLCPNS